MSEENQSVKTNWTSVQVYAMSLLCLLVGVTMGYLLRGSTAAQASNPSITAMPQPKIPAGTPQMGGAPTEAGGMPGAAQPGPEQLKAMAEKKVAPLLETLKTNPNDTDTLTKVGMFYIAAGQFNESAQYFEKVTSIKPSADAWTKLANAQAYGGSADQAMASLNKALQIDPKFANALYNLGMLKWQAKGDVKGAVACWEKLIKTNPDHPQLDQVRKLIAHAKQQQGMPAPGAN